MEQQIPKTRFRRELNSIIRNIKQGRYEVVAVTKNQELWRVVMAHDLFVKLTKSS